MFYGQDADKDVCVPGNVEPLARRRSGSISYGQEADRDVSLPNTTIYIERLEDVKMELISVRERPEYKDRVIEYFQSKWASEASMKVYEDSITSCLETSSPLPQWYILEDAGAIIGCAGLITNDFISRMDLYPWVCAIYIEKEHRGNSFGKILLERAMEDTKKGGFNSLHLCTDLDGYYEKYGFDYIGVGYHPWGEESKVYKIDL